MFAQIGCSSYDKTGSACDNNQDVVGEVILRVEVVVVNWRLLDAIHPAFNFGTK